VRYLLLVLALATTSLPALAQAPEVPQGISEMYSQFYGALATGDQQGASAFIAEEAMLFMVLENGGDTRAVLELPQQYALESLEPTISACVVEVDAARVACDLHIVGVDKAAGDDVDRTERRIDWLRKTGEDWRILRSVAVDPETSEQLVAGGAVQDKEFGVSLAVPEGWEAQVVGGNCARQFAVVGSAPAAMLTLFIQEVPEAPEPAKIGDSFPKVMPQLGGSAKLLGEAAVQVAGRPAHRAEYELQLRSLTVQHAQVAYVRKEDVGATLYVLALTATRAESFSEAKPAFEQLLAGAALTERQPTAFPPEYGIIADGRYYNAERQVRMDIPDGWAARLMRNGGKPFMLVLSRPGSENHVVLIMVDIGVWVDPKEALQSSIKGGELGGGKLTTIDEGPIEKGEVSGYQATLQGNRDGDKTCTLWQAFLMRSTTLFVLGGFTSPQESYDDLKADWQAMLDSLKLGAEALEGE